MSKHTPTIPRFKRAFCVIAVLFALIFAPQGAEAATVWFTDSAGRRVAVPVEIHRALPAGPPVAVILYTSPRTS